MSSEQNNNSGEQQFKIQPHPATTNNPADLQGGQGGLQSGGANVFSTPGPQILSENTIAGLEAPKSRAELEALAQKLNQ